MDSCPLTLVWSSLPLTFEGQLSPLVMGDVNSDEDSVGDVKNNFSLLAVNIKGHLRIQHIFEYPYCNLKDLINEKTTQKAKKTCLILRSC